jgi:hypothetical protein
MTAISWVEILKLDYFLESSLDSASFDSDSDGGFLIYFLLILLSP